MGEIGLNELGYNEKLYILAFDHRGSFEKMVGGDHDKVAGAKRLIWEGFQRAVEEGRGGVSRLARLTGMSRPTILKGIAELQSGALETRAETGRVRQAGGGRKPVEAVTPAVDAARIPESARAR